MNAGLFARLDSWFGKTDYTIIHHWVEEVDDSMTLFAVAKTEVELVFMRVFTVGEQLHVFADKRTLISEL